MEPIHLAAIEAGRVTSLCGRPMPSNLSWTTRPEAVTCPRCVRLVCAAEARERADARDALAPEAGA